MQRTALGTVGFTLIELLVVISIIGILATVLLANFNAARERSRDAQRKADARNISTALRLYYNDYGGFPLSGTGSNAGKIMGCGQGGRWSCEWGQSFIADGKVYMSVLPKDPLPSQVYKYTQTDADTYTFDACLENKSDDRGIDTTDLTWCPSGRMFEIKP